MPSRLMARGKAKRGGVWSRGDVDAERGERGLGWSRESDLLFFQGDEWRSASLLTICRLS